MGEQSVGVGVQTTGVGVQSADVGVQTAGVGDQSAGVGVQIVGVGDQSANVGVQTVGVGVQTAGVGVKSASVAGPSNACLQKPIVIAGQKEKLPKFNGDGTADPIRHYKTCETIWKANGITDEDDWMRQFLATLRGIAIDWFTDTNPQKLNSWDNIKKEFLAEFKLLRDDNEINASRQWNTNSRIIFANARNTLCFIRLMIIEDEFQCSIISFCV